MQAEQLNDTGLYFWLTMCIFGVDFHDVDELPATTEHTFKLPI